MSTAVRVTLSTVLGIIALLFFGVGYIYMHRQAAHLPQILGPIKHAHFHRTKREYASFILGAIFLVAALLVAFLPGRTRRTQVVETNGVASTGV